MITKVIKLDINKNLYEKIKAKQGDTKSRFLLFQLLDGSMPFNLENRSVRAYMLKPDSTEVFNDLIINNRNTGHCTLELTNQVLAVAGIVKIELMIIENDKKITSSIFELQVDKSINSENSIVSTNEFNALLNGLASLSEYDNYKEKAKKVPELEENIQELGSQLDNIANEVSKYGASPLLEDNASFIQKALDKRGTVLINKPGVYNCGQLILKSNTTLILGDGVTLRLKNNTNNYLLVNEHWKKEETVWDENIHIIGGTFDFNKENNTNYNGNIQVGEYIGCGIVLNHLKNFSVTNVNKLTNAKKYCILYGNALNGVFKNIRIENESDGIHGQCNLKNIKISNISGVTGDNMIPFTLGDYTSYTLADEGDVENISISNIYGDIDTQQMDLIRFIGSGKNNTNKVKNVKIKNIKGNTGDLPLIWFMDKDIPDNNIYLKNTVVENIDIENIDKVGGTTYLISLTSKISNIKINNIKIEEEISTQLFYFNNEIKNLEFNNLIINGTLTKSLALFKTDGQANLPLIDFNRLNIKLTNSNSYIANLFDLRMYGKNQIINFNNCNINIPSCYLIACEQANGYNAINLISLNNTIFTGSHIYNITGEYIHSFYLNNSNITTTNSGNIGVNGTISQLNSKVNPSISLWKEVIYNTGWQNHPTTGLSYSKNGLYVNIEGLCQTTGNSITETKILTLPNGYKPVKDIFIPMSFQNRTNESFESNIINIKTDGSVLLINPIPNSVGILAISAKFMYKTQ